ncbi:FxSxx-COOH system tetratricopeptide repeat protein [Micromonospora chersina]
MSNAAADGWDFFVSYTQADRGWAEWIAWQLEQDRYRVLVQAWDMVPGANWVHRMDQGVQSAARTIAVLSPDYLTSVYGKAEWQAAWRDDPLGERSKLLPVRVAPCERPGLLGQIVMVDLVGLSEAAARRRLNETIRTAVAGRAKPPVEPAFPAAAGRAVPAEPKFPGALPEVWNLPARNPNFTGRETELARLQAELWATSTVAVHALHGMGGVGKTQLAIEYAHRHATDYDVVWWITAEETATVAGQLAKLGAKLGVPSDSNDEAAAEAVRDHLRGTNRWLLVFDNAEKPQQIQHLLPGGAGHVLITTRRAGYGAIARVVDVDVLQRAEAVALLHRRLPTITADQAEQLAELVEDLPLALEQAAAYLETTGLPVSQYLGLLETRLADIIDRGSVAGRQETLATLWRLSYQQIAEHHPAAIQLLQLCGWLAPEAIPLDLFTNHANLLPEPLLRAAADPLAFSDTVGVLVDYSLVRRAEQHLSLHRLIQATTRNTGTEAEVSESHVVVLGLLYEDLPGDIRDRPEHWPRWAQLLPHVLAATEHQTGAPATARLQTSWLLDCAANYLQTHGQPASALPLLQHALAIDEADHGPDHPAVAACLNNLAGVLQDLGQPADAKPLLERALAIDETTYGPDHPAVAATLNNVASMLLDLGQPADAKPLLERALAIDETTYGPDHPTVVPELGNLVNVLRDLGQSADAKPLLERALAIDETTYGPDHPTVAADLSSLAGVLGDLGQPADAKPFAERALTINEATYGPDHPTVAADLNTLAGVLRDLEQPADAKPLLERALTINEATYGPDHPTVAANLNNLAGVLGDLGQPADAKPLLERALTIDEAIFHPDHPTIAIDLSNLAGTLQDLGQPADAQPLAERAVAITENAYGPDHPSIAIRLSNLARVLRDLEQPADAKALLERALTITENAYGPDHPTTAIALSNLAGVLGDLGHPADAKPLLERALTITENAYGPDHPAVATRLSNLDRVLRDLEQPADNEPVLKTSTAIRNRVNVPRQPPSH